MKKKELVVVCFKYPPIYSGYGKQMELVLKKLISKTDEFHITILTAYEESAYKDENFNIIPMLGKSDNKDESVFPFAWKVFRWLKKNKSSIDLIHCLKAGPEAISCNIISKTFQIPLIVKVVQEEFSERDLNAGNKIRRIKLKLRKKILSFVDYYIAISDEIEQNILNMKSRKTKIIRIPNGVDTELFHSPLNTEKKTSIRENINLKQDELIILYIGAINKRKGIPELLNSMEFLDTDKQVRLVLCGPTLENVNLDEKVHSFNLTNTLIKIEYHGKISNPEEYMRAADIFILPSHSEGLPNVLLEAGASGLPLIATDIGGSREIVTNEINGYIINVGDAQNMAECLNKLINNNSLRTEMAKKAEEFINENYSIDSVSEKYIELYKTILY